MAKPNKKLLEKKFAKRFEEYNIKVLEELAEVINKFNGLNYTQAMKVANQLRYDRSYIDLIDELVKLTGKSKKEIKDVLEETVKENIEFADVYFKARNLETPIYENDAYLKDLVISVANMNEDNFVNLAKSTGFAFQDEKGHIKFLNMRDTYYKVIDESLYAISEGKETFNERMRKTIKQLTNSGVRRIVYTNDGKQTYTQRIDTAIRRNLQDGVREISRNSEMELGKRFGADGVEITVHENPAPDHEDVQGKQFSFAEFEKFQNDERAITYDGEVFEPEYDGRDRRSIGQYNCYHDIINIILGVTKPLYTKEQLLEIKYRANEEIEIDGNKYTRYECTQLQRGLETEIRKAKERHIMYKKNEDRDGMLEEQLKITQLRRKYFEISKLASTPNLLSDRATVSGYRPIKEPKIVETVVKEVKTKPSKTTEYFNNEEYFNMYVGDLADHNVDVSSSVVLIDEDIRNKQLGQLLNLTEKYPLDRYSENGLTFICGNTSHKRWIGEASYRYKQIILNKDYFMDKNKIIETEKRMLESKWHYKVPDDKLDIYTLTHEYGHNIEYEYFRNIQNKYKQTGRVFRFTTVDSELRDTIISNAMQKLGTKMSKTEFREKYFSKYANSRRNYEWFAELFAKTELGEQDAFTEAFKEWLGGFYGR